MNKHYPTGRQTSYCMYRSRTKTAFCFSRISKFGLSSTRLPAGQCLVVLVQRLLLVHKERNFSSSIEGVCLRLGRIKNINNRLPMTHRKYIMYSAHYQKNCELSLLDFLIPIRSGILRNQSKWQSSQSHFWVLLNRRRINKIQHRSQNLQKSANSRSWVITPTKVSVEY